MHNKRSTFPETDEVNGVALEELAANAKQHVQTWLRSRDAKPDEHVEFEWLIFVTYETPADGISVRSLDFKAMASYTTDLRPALNIVLQQRELLAENGLEPERCRMVDYAYVCESYVPGQAGAFLMRHGPLDKRGNSGWVIGGEQPGHAEVLEHE